MELLGDYILFKKAIQFSLVNTLELWNLSSRCWYEGISEDFVEMQYKTDGY